MKSNQKIAAIIGAATLASVATFAQPILSTTYATKDVAGCGLVFSETPVVKSKVEFDSEQNYASFEQTNFATQGKEREFFYNRAAIGTAYTMPQATIALEASTVNVGGIGRSNELWAKMTANLPLKPSIAVSSDVGAISGQYIGLSASKSAKLGSLDVAVEGEIGFNDHYSTSISAWSHARLDVSATKQITPHISVSGMARFQKSLNPAFKDTQMYSLNAAYKF